VQCEDVIDTPTVLTTDLTCDTNPALTVQGPGGALDLRGHTVRCVDNQNQDGIVLEGNGALVQHGTVANCASGVSVQGSGGHRVEGMTLRNNTENGLVTVSNGNVVTLSSAHDNGTSGFITSLTSNGNAFTQNVARNNQDGFFVDGNSNNNTLTHNIAQSNREDGFVVLGNNSTLNQNVATQNGNVGFSVEGNNNTLNQNVATQNGGDGIGVIGSANTVTQNAVTSNARDGIDVRAWATGNILTENASAGHRGVSPPDPDEPNPANFDLEDDNPNCDANTWTRNVGSRNQNCIH
jgi:parallel beta-helix repeat protein